MLHFGSICVEAMSLTRPLNLKSKSSKELIWSWITCISVAYLGESGEFPPVLLVTRPVVRRQGVSGLIRGEGGIRTRDLVPRLVIADRSAELPGEVSLLVCDEGELALGVLHLFLGDWRGLRYLK